MELTFACPQCARVEVIKGVETAPVVACPSCGYEKRVAGGSVEADALVACPVCATSDLYIQKDFPHVLGLAIVVVGFAVSSVFWYFYMPVAAMAVLLTTAALDLVLYYLVPDVTICYRCLSQYRGPGSNADSRFGPFDLAIGERYRQERLRIEQLRQRREPSDAPATPPPGSRFAEKT